MKQGIQLLGIHTVKITSKNQENDQSIRNTNTTFGPYANSWGNSKKN